MGLGAEGCWACTVSKWEPWEGPEQRKERAGSRFSQDPTGYRGTDWRAQGPEQGSSETAPAVVQGAGTKMVAVDEDSVFTLKIKLAFGAVLSCS